MLTQQTILCWIPSAWNPESRTGRLVRRLARAGNRLLLIFPKTAGPIAAGKPRRGFFQIEPRLYGCRLPVPGAMAQPTFLPILRRWMHLMNFNQPILWLFGAGRPAEALARGIASRLILRQQLTEPAGPVRPAEAPGELRLLDRVNLVIADTPACQAAWSGRHNRVCTWAPEQQPLETLTELIEGELEILQWERENHWEKRWAADWLRSLRKIFRVTLAIGLVYVALFHTPLVWWLAQPLKQAAPPQPADAIVVLAGGVGESGRPGQGYEERVARGVALYQAGWAPKILLASGYSYRFQETEVMKALALSLGVPERNILLESEGRNTLEEARRIGALLETLPARKVLLVSSPYHMRRAVGTFSRQTPEIDWIPVPIEKSLFYPTERPPRWKQIEGLLHEVLAVAYYRFNGWM
ncbi:MAG: hypothetical protein COV76_01525 [Candidatus Omnitrophica bacterium CG11_big_fil_rev_8_21_14_0_20_64_10]|nr:MAG: hypothetical protein COV76_01525 [Candidatus Omnitrophica bacterium CG11_big_fil_rev_8_21_14_0_20_64_10]